MNEIPVLCTRHIGATHHTTSVALCSTHHTILPALFSVMPFLQRDKRMCSFIYSIVFVGENFADF